MLTWKERKLRRMQPLKMNQIYSPFLLLQTISMSRSFILALKPFAVSPVSFWQSLKSSSLSLLCALKSYFYGTWQELKQKGYPCSFMYFLNGKLTLRAKWDGLLHSKGVLKKKKIEKNIPSYFLDSNAQLMCFIRAVWVGFDPIWLTVPAAWANSPTTVIR